MKIAEATVYDDQVSIAVELMKKQDYDVENALVTKEKNDGTAFNVTCLNRMLYDAAKSCQAFLVCRDTARAATRNSSMILSHTAHN